MLDGRAGDAFHGQMQIPPLDLKLGCAPLKSQILAEIEAVADGGHEVSRPAGLGEGRTNERLDFAGRMEGIAAMAMATVELPEN